MNASSTLIDVNPRALLLDDGEYIVEMAADEPAPRALAFLRRRCYEGVTTPDGMECIGRVVRTDRGLWSAFIDSDYNALTGLDVREIAASNDRATAVASLWQARRDARCRHQDA